MSACVVQRVNDIADEVSAREGVSLNDLEPSTALRVRTRHSEYRILVWRGTTVLLKGGRQFPHFTVCRINGSGLGGSLLKLALDRRGAAHGNLRRRAVRCDVTGVRDQNRRR